MQGRHRAATTAVDQITGWLADMALSSAAAGDVFAGCCTRVRAAGVPLIRGSAAFRVLHPLYETMALRWTSAGIETEHFGWDDRDSPEWLASPLYHAIVNRLPILRRRLTGRAALLDFTILRELRDLGGTDYVCCIVPFDAEWRNGVAVSWLGDRRQGFTEREVGNLATISQHLAVTMKAKIEGTIARNVASAYLGPAAGDAVLQGAIRRGDGEAIDAALFYSDLRGSTRLADRMPVEDFLATLNAHFERTAGAVQRHGGEIVSYIGDGVLALFRAEDDLAGACAHAVDAARDAVGGSDAAASPEFGVALHAGRVIHGNIGLPDRLQFTVIGAAVNEVVRVQDLTKAIGAPLLVTGALADRVPHAWHSHGAHTLRGVDAPVEVLAPSDYQPRSEGAGGA